MKLLGRVSSINVRKVLWTAAQLGLDLDREDWGAGFRSPQEPGYLALNPNGLIPVLLDGDFVLWESNSICRYLAARAGDTVLLPAGPQARARVEQWMDWQAGELNNSWRVAFMALVRGQPATPEAVAAGCADIARQLVEMRYGDGLEVAEAADQADGLDGTAHGRGRRAGLSGARNHSAMIRRATPRRITPSAAGWLLIHADWRTSCSTTSTQRQATANGS